MAYPKMVKWMYKEKRWSKSGKKFETKVLNETELEQLKDFFKSDTKIKMIMVEDIINNNEENL